MKSLFGVKFGCRQVKFSPKGVSLRERWNDPSGKIGDFATSPYRGGFALPICAHRFVAPERGDVSCADRGVLHCTFSFPLHLRSSAALSELLGSKASLV